MSVPAPPIPGGKFTNPLASPVNKPLNEPLNEPVNEPVALVFVRVRLFNVSPLICDEPDTTPFPALKLSTKIVLNLDVSVPRVLKLFVSGIISDEIDEVPSESNERTKFLSMYNPSRIESVPLTCKLFSVNQ